MKLRLLASVAIIGVALTSCQTMRDNPKQTGGTVLGAALGGLLGSQFGSGTGKLVATGLGVAAGAWIGSEIGASLDRADKAAIEQRSTQALDSARDGETIRWKNPDSGANARITPTSTRRERRKIAVLRNKNVAAIPPLDLIGEPYEALKAANVRAAPATDSAITTRLRAGETFEAVGRVQGRNWIVVSKNRRTVGYVYAPLVGRARARMAGAGRPAQQTALRPALNLDDIKESKAIDLDAEGLVAEEVVATAECRTMNVEVANKAGQSEQSTYKACKAADGAWEIL